MKMNIRQDIIIKATEVRSATQYMAGSDIRKGEVVRFRDQNLLRDGISIYYGVCDGVDE